MTALSALGGAISSLQTNLSALTLNQAQTSATPVPASFLTQPSSVVSLGQSAFAGNLQTYSASGINAGASVSNDPLAAALVSSAPVWQNAQGDAVSALMATNLGSATLAGRFQGLGAALLNGLKSKDGDYSQAVLNPSLAQLNGTPSPAALSDMVTTLHQATDNTVTLKVETTSGVLVDISLNDQADGMAVQVTTSGTLSDDERAALGKLADAFQSAIDGISAATPTLDLSGLTQYDSSVLQSVDLKAQIPGPSGVPQTFDFHADSASRSVSFSGLGGSMNVNVDTSNPAIEGTRAQQLQAITQYTQQFDAEGTRGQGNTSMISMLKDAFTQMNSPYNLTQAQETALKLSSIPLQDQDHAMLTGLADFSASVSDTPVESNPMRLNEVDTFAYNVSQTTKVQGNNELNRSILQSQQSNLQASYHAPLKQGDTLNLTTDKKSQNYYYDRIDDSATSSADIAYDKGHLTNASLTQSASRSTHVQKYELGKLVQDTTTPTSVLQEQDFTGVLKPYLEDHSVKTAQQKADWQQTLAGIHDKVFLQADPGMIEQWGGP